MTQRISVLLCLLFTVILFIVGCGKTEAPAKSPSLTAESLTLSVGQSHKLDIENKGELSFQWESSNSDVVRVLYGAVTALSEGEAEIYAVSSDLKLTCQVKVIKGEEDTTNNSSQHSSSQVNNESDKSGSSSVASEKSDAEKTREAANKLIADIIDNKYNKKADELKQEYDNAVAQIDNGIAAVEKLMNSDTAGDAEKQYWKNQRDALIADKQRLKEAYDSALAEINRQREEEKNSPDGLIK